MFKINKLHNFRVGLKGPVQGLLAGLLSLSVLGRKREPYDRSIDVHVSNLRKKLLSASSKAIEIETVRAVGYRLKVTR
jgi:two-component system OmpR family response regulator